MRSCCIPVKVKPLSAYLLYSILLLFFLLKKFKLLCLHRFDLVSKILASQCCVLSFQICSVDGKCRLYVMVIVNDKLVSVCILLVSNLKKTNFLSEIVLSVYIGIQVFHSLLSDCYNSIHYNTSVS